MFARSQDGLRAQSLVGDSIEGFQLKRIRSGVETLLAAHGVSREIRGHLQSHGLTGVQARHYDGHDYMAEKRRALEILVREVCKAGVSAARADITQGRKFDVGMGPKGDARREEAGVSS